MESYDDINSMVMFWFDNKNKWFDSTPEFDAEISTRFAPLLLKYDISRLCKNVIKYIEDRFVLSIGLIILHDQIPRHIYRDIYRHIYTDENREQIDKHLYDILDFAKSFYIKNKYDITEEYFCFALLPFRHTNNFDNIMFVIEETKSRIKINKNNLVYKKFLKATLDRYIKFNNDKSNIILSNTLDNTTMIIDKTQICEKELITYTPLSFDKLNENIKNNDIPKYIIEFIDIIKKNNIVDNGIISLSGGVDSMVLSYFLKYIGVNIVALHINYNNRKECLDECNIIHQWCDFINTKLYIRKIIEINRKDMMEWNSRDLYETYTRDIRYNAYINLCHNNNIFMGHNHDDQFENIFTNIVSESHYNNLRGMTISTTQTFKQEKITFIRPMLNVPKKIIYKIASYIGIPYFKDSTPKWSQRGKIRDNIRPQIDEWDPRAITSFFKLSDKMSELVQIAEILAKTISNQIQSTKMWTLDLNESHPKMLYELIFKHLSIHMTQKSIQVFYEKLNFIKINKQKYKLNSIEKITLNKEHIINWKNMNDMNIIIYF